MSFPASTSPHSSPSIAGYTIVEQLYLGSRTAVYRAVQADSQRPVVIKVLRREYPSLSELVQFRNQYTIAKLLPFPSIVQPLSLETLGNSYALVMEDFGCMSLGQYVQQHPLDLAEVLAITLQLAEILHQLYQNRVVHKDIKPANILIHPDSNQVKLIDFSIASLLPKETQEIQNPNILEGTLAYLAPEQTGRMNRGIDYRADFYALGVTLYQLLSGKLPFAADDPLELMHSHIAKVPVPVNRVQADVPAIVAAIVAKLMAKNAEDRYQSALGLKHDLEQCLTQWKAKGAIAAFELGQRDLSDRFLIPEKLYGREAEVQAILEAFDRVCGSSESELMLVAGFSGIGKTAIVNEVHKPIVRQRGYFIKGKYDQFQRNIPFSAFVRAFRDLMGQLLSESDAQLATWKVKIKGAVGENAQVIVDVIPELEQIIGQQLPVPELSGSAAQNRFNLLFQKFIQVFTTPDHPLVIFLDDLQWADLASLNLLELLMGEASRYLLVLGAYRDNEVFPAHPLMLTLEQIQKAQTIVNTITLEPLVETTVNQLVADSLSCPAELAYPLTQLLYQKTKGNPFFTTQFLKALYEEGWIQFQPELGYWQCDMTSIRQLTLTNDVVEFMTLQLQKLPVETQEVLKLAACIGNKFDLNTLAIVSEKSCIDTATNLWKALQAGLILPITETYKFFQSNVLDTSDRSGEIAVAYKFFHDRVQQAAYSLITAEQKQITHLQIGRLLRHAIAGEPDQSLFAIVNHLNQGALLIEDEQQQELVQLNLAAGQKAKNATAYGAALNYFNTGISLLRGDGWQRQYDLTLALYEGAAESAYLCTDFEQVEQLAEVTLNYAQSWLDRVNIYKAKIQACVAQNQPLEALRLAREVLQHLGVLLPEQPHQAEVRQALQHTQALLGDRPIASLLELPQMTAPDKQAAMMILSSIRAATYQTAPTLSPLVNFAQIDLSLKYGNAPESALGYVQYGSTLIAIVGDIDTGFRFGQLGMNLLQRINAPHVAARTILGFNSLRHWQEPAKDTVNGFLQAYFKALETGDIEFVALSLLSYSFTAYLSGQELSSLRRTMTEHRKVMQQFRHDNYFRIQSIYYQTVLNLLELTDEPDRLYSKDYDEAAMIQHYLEANQALALFQIYFCKLLLSYLFQRYEQALENVHLAERYLSAAAGLMHVPIFCFYDALVQLAIYQTKSETDQISILDRVAADQEKLSQWAVHAPSNQAHRCALVAAERCRVLNQKAEAIELYDRAIAEARENEYIQEEAIANELAAKFYLSWGKEKIAQDYLTKAYYGYVHWGAKAKVQDLENRYPHLLALIWQQQITLSATETVFETQSIPSQVPGTESSTSGSTGISATLDLATVLKASRTLSSEIQLDKLLATLLHTVIENAGASKGALLMPRENQWFVEAVATLDRPARVQSVSLSSSHDISHGLINIVKHSLQPVVIVDAATHSILATDVYVVQQQPKSMLSIPILGQGKLVAILYLENQLTVGAFTRDRVELLNLLCAQAAISLQNAHLYQQAQTYTQQLEQSQLQIVQSEKMASLGNLVAGIAHEINNPLGFLNGSINNAEDYVHDILAHLDLYQQHHSNPAAPVQAHADEIDLAFLSEDLPKLLDSMKGATDRIKGISTSLRTFSRADTDYKVSANLHDGLDSTVLILKYRLKANEHRPEICVVKQYGELPQVECFPGQLNQVFMNILANAIDVFDEAAQLSSFANIKAKPQKITIQTAITAQNEAVEIRIRDNGKGMTEDVKARIFDHLFTTKNVGKGTGLGLAIAHQIVVEKHGGSLDVQSEVGQGTEFSIRLPIQ